MAEHRAKSAMEMERTTLTNLLLDVTLANDDRMHVIDELGGLKARLINRGHPAGYVVNQDGTFMVTVEFVSRAVMAVEGEAR